MKQLGLIISYQTFLKRNQSNDKIRILDYYSLEQLLEFLDIDNIENKEIYLNNVIANLEDSVYENFNVKIQDKYIESEEDNYEDEVYGEDIIQEEVISKPVDKVREIKEPVKTTKEETNSLIVVNVNGQTLILNSKKKYLFVDILDVYPFDMSQAGKKQLVMTINGESCTFADELSDGDIIELRWR